jgi:digeranylgeranylglycerophospholipid reductase
MQVFKDKYDIIVVGAGPAGSVAARYAAENGADVLMLERDREPGIPVRCAEGVSHAGIAQFIDIDERWISTTIEGASLHSPNGEFFEMYNNGMGYVLERRVFDRALADLACSKGAQLMMKTDVVDLLFDDNKKVCGVKLSYLGRIYDIKAKIVIGADGVESQIGKWGGINTTLKLGDLDTCVQYTLTNINVNPKICRFYFGNDVAPGGYVWIFPKSDKIANVGIGIGGDDCKPGKGPKYYLDKFVEKTFPNASPNYIVYGGVPTSNGTEFVTDNLMIVGDAARQVNPITGGGIVQVMIAGRICGETAAQALKDNNFSKKYLSSYEKRWDKIMGANQKFMYSVKNIYTKMNDDKLNSIVKACKKLDPEKLTMQALFKEAIKEDPMMVAKLATSFIVSKIRFDW